MHHALHIMHTTNFLLQTLCAPAVHRQVHSSSAHPKPGGAGAGELLLFIDRATSTVNTAQLPQGGVIQAVVFHGQQCKE